ASQRGYSHRIGPRIATAIAALVIVGCGSSLPSHARQTTRSSTTAAVLQQGHPQAIEPVAGAASHVRTSALATQTTSARDPVPTAPATITRAPAKGAPTDAEVRAAVARFQAAVARYHLDRL